MSGYRQLFQHGGYSQDFSTSVYSHVKYSYASKSSQATQLIELLEIGFHEPGFTNDSYLREFLGSGEEVSGHDGTCAKLLEKLKQMVQTDGVDFEGSRRMSFATTPIRPLFVNADIRPDVFVNVERKTFLQFGVHSTKSQSDNYKDDEYNSTVKKLAVGLAEQLRCLRQADVNTTEIVGYYLPTDVFSDHPIEKVTCNWNEVNLNFAISCQILSTLSSAEEDIKAVFAKQKDTFERANFNQTPSPLLPLTTNFLTKNFGENAKQLCSGESFVVECDEKIYKRPVLFSERERLQYCMTNADIRPSKSIIPVSVKWIGRKTFYELEKCTYQPLSKLAARCLFNSTTDRRQWLNGVVEAIRELHGLGIAHLDIRLPNICYRSDLTPVLIDLDRSVDKVDFQTAKEFAILRAKYSNSQMYSIDSVANPDQIGDNIYKLDFKQLAIMLLDLLENNEVYDSKPKNLEGSHQFLRELYKGNFNEELYERFLENQN